MTGCATCADALLTSLDIFGPMHVDNVDVWARLHDFTTEQINDTLGGLVLARMVEIDGQVVRYVGPPRAEDVPPEFLAKADAYRRSKEQPPTLVMRLSDAWLFFVAVVWPRISHAAIALVLILLTAGGLIVACSVRASGVEDIAAGRWMMAEVTAYCPCALCCGTHDRTTANNTNTDVVPYAFAADRSLPFDARVYVPAGLGVLDRIRADDRWFAVDDRGGALDTEARRYGVLRLDLRVREHAWAVRFGRRSLPVYVTTNP
jgi:hypothetical protein